MTKVPHLGYIVVAWARESLRRCWIRLGRAWPWRSRLSVVFTDEGKSESGTWVGTHGGVVITM